MIEITIDRDSKLGHSIIDFETLSARGRKAKYLNLLRESFITWLIDENIQYRIWFPITRSCITCRSNTVDEYKVYYWSFKEFKIELSDEDAMLFYLRWT